MTDFTNEPLEAADKQKKMPADLQANLLGRVGLLTEKVSTLQELVLLQEAEKQSLMEQMRHKVESLEENLAVELHYNRHQHFLTSRDTAPQALAVGLPYEALERTNSRNQWLLKLAVTAGLIWATPYLLALLARIVKNSLANIP